jgi:hypothetical protein
VSIKRINRGRNHSYVIDGEKAIGVTTAISEGFPKPALPYWAAKTVAQAVVDMHPDDLRAMVEELGRDAAVHALKQAPWTQRDKAAARGTEVHHLAEKLITGVDVDVPEPLIGHVESVVRFLDEWQVRPVLTELTVGNYTYNYAGTFDVIADLPDGRRVLFDYKTSSGVWPDVALQLAAYRHASHYVAADGTEIPMVEVGIDEAKVVHVRADGYDVVPFNTDRDVFAAFLNVLAVARARTRMDSWKGEVELPAQVAA